MTDLKSKVCDAVAAELTDDAIGKIAEKLVHDAQTGDRDALHLVLGFAAASEISNRKCAHPKNVRTLIGPQTMGNKRPLQEQCACGVMLIDGEPVAEE